MSFEKRKIRNAVLIRLHEDGRIGAQESGLEQVLEDGAVISSKETEPVQLGTADFDGPVSLTDVLGEVTANALIQIEQLTQQVGSLAQKNESLSEQLQAALAEIERLTATQAVEPAPEPEQA